MPEPSLQEGKSQQRSSTLDTVLKISSLLLATTWIFFLVGWFYLHVFYGCFGIDVNTLDLPIYYPVIASQFAFDEFITLLCCIFALGYLTGNIWVFEDKIRRWLSRVFPPFPFQLSSPHKERAEQVHRWIWRIFAWVILPPFVLTELVMMSIQLGQQEGKD